MPRMAHKEVLYISNLYERSTILLLKEILRHEAFDGVKVQPGKIILPPGFPPPQREALLALLEKYKLRAVREHEEVIVEQILRVEVLNMLKNGKGFDDIVTQITSRYDVDRGSFERYYQDFIEMLNHYHLIDYEG